MEIGYQTLAGMPWLRRVPDGTKERGAAALYRDAEAGGLSRCQQGCGEGQKAYVTLLPLSLDERAAFPGAAGELWSSLLAGGYPRIFDQGFDPCVWLGDYAAIYVERDVRQLLRVGDLRAFSTFLALVAGRTGQELNASV